MQTQNPAETISLFCRLNINTKREIPIRASEMGLLILTVQGKDTVTPAQAAAYFHISKPMVAAMVRSLSDKGYLTKKQAVDDRRSYHLVPTKAAHTLVDTTFAAYNKTITRLRAQMGEPAFGALIQSLAEANTILMNGEEA